MDPQTFWLYSFLSVSLIWGVFGLRFALSVLLANVVVAIILFVLPEQYDSSLGDALLIAYPLYWGLAFFLLRWIEFLPLPQLPVAPRAAIGCILAIIFGLAAHRDAVSRYTYMLYATYMAPVAERPELLRKGFAASSYGEVCLDSNATLMQMALHAGDKDVIRVLLDVFSRCHSASTTMTQVVKPLFDSGDLGSLEFLMENGLKPSTLVAGSAYRGTALCYAATVADNKEIVRSLISHDPEDARSLHFLSVIFSTLTEQGNEAMLNTLHDAGLEYAVPTGQ